MADFASLIDDEMIFYPTDWTIGEPSEEVVREHGHNLVVRQIVFRISNEFSAPLLPVTSPLLLHSTVEESKLLSDMYLYLPGRETDYVVLSVWRVV